MIVLQLRQTMRYCKLVLYLLVIAPESRQLLLLIEKISTAVTPGVPLLNGNCGLIPALYSYGHSQAHIILESSYVPLHGHYKSQKIVG